MTKEEEIVVFHYVLGVAIANFSAVENTILRLMSGSFPNERLNREAIAIGFFSLEGFRSRLILADAVISRKLGVAPKQLRDQWRPLHERARALSTQRNKLAHWGSAQYWHRRPGLRVVLAPWIYKKTDKKTKKPQPPPGSLTIREIYRLSMSFLALAAALENYYARVSNTQERHAASDEQPGHPPTPEYLAGLIREVFSKKPQPSPEKS